MIQHFGLAGIARIAIALLMLFGIAGTSAWSLAGDQTVALADDSDDWDDDSDDDGRDDDRRDDDDSSGKRGGSNSGSGNNGKGGGGENSGRGNQLDDDDDDHDRVKSRSGDDYIWPEDEPIVAYPSSTAIPAQTPVNGQRLEETGTLRIEAFRCSERPANDDWEATCLDVDGMGRFELEADDAPNRGWFRKIEPSSTGVITVDSLPSGRYELDRINGVWCHAEASRVDADGDVIILPGETTTVWVYTCDIFAK